jgi:hypothetical protein
LFGGWTVANLPGQTASERIGLPIIICLLVLHPTVQMVSHLYVGPVFLEVFGMLQIVHGGDQMFTGRLAFDSAVCAAS